MHGQQATDGDGQDGISDRITADKFGACAPKIPPLSDSDLCLSANWEKATNAAHAARGTKASNLPRH